jgi:hypothetical protein
MLEPYTDAPAAFCPALARLSLYLSSGGAVRPRTLPDEYERLAIEAQISRAILQRSPSWIVILWRSYSDPSPFRIIVMRPPATTRRGEKGEEQSSSKPRALMFWLL